MIVIGLTGGAGAGKTTVARWLAELGAAVVDADAVARELSEPGQPAYAALVAAFGRDILAPDGRLDRRRLARLAFGDPEALARLNAATHPHIVAAIRRRLEELRAAGCRVAVLDAPLLFETGLDAVCHQVWVVEAEEEQQVSRLAARAGLTPAEARARLRAQGDPAARRRRADVVIDNRGSLEETRRQVLAAWERVAGRGTARVRLLAAALAAALLAVALWGLARLLYPLPYRDLIFAAAARHGLDPLLVAAVVRVESRFHPGAVSSVGARGLMQVLPGTGEWVAGRIGLEPFRADLLYDPEVNLAIGTWYLAYLQDEFGGRLPAALAAYNAGRETVRRWLAAGEWDGEARTLGRVPYPETRRFVRLVLRDYRIYRFLYAPARDRPRP